MTKEKIISTTVTVLKIVAGVFLYAAGFQFFTYQNNIIVGGISGIAMIITRFADIPIGVVIAILNLPLFVISWKNFGKKFMLISFAIMLLSSTFIDLLGMVRFHLTSDLLLASAFGGAVKGIGLGLMYSTGASGGGIEIIARLVRRSHPHINFGTILMVIDIIVISIYAIMFRSYEIAMYAILSSVVFSQVVDFVLYGRITSKACYIITDKSEEISEMINGQLYRGATLLHAKGAYFGNEKEVILCVLRHQQIVDLRKMVAELDEHAFMIVCDAREVYGIGFGSISSDS